MLSKSYVMVSLTPVMIHGKNRVLVSNQQTTLPKQLYLTR